MTSGRTGLAGTAGASSARGNQTSILSLRLVWSVFAPPRDCTAKAWHHRETQTRATARFFCREKRIESSRERRIVHPGSGIGDGHDHIVTPMLAPQACRGQFVSSQGQGAGAAFGIASRALIARSEWQAQAGLLSTRARARSGSSVISRSIGVLEFAGAIP